MEMSKSQFIPAAQEKVWTALDEPELLKACIPGCELIEQAGANSYRIVMQVKVGPVRARFSGKMDLIEMSPPDSRTLNFEGQGGVAGFAKGKADVRLSPEGGGTRLAYAVRAQIGGKLAQIGSRLVDGAAKKMADDFFTAFVERLGGASPVPAAAPEAAPPDAAVQGSSEAPQ